MTQTTDNNAAQPCPACGEINCYDHALRTIPTPQPVDGAGVPLYVASRASLPERGQMWRDFRARGYRITSSWIDEDGEGATESYEDLWLRITNEIASSAALVLYAESGDFPLKGALIEAGIALGMNKPVFVCLPRVDVHARSCRPIGSWIKHPLVSRIDHIEPAMRMAYSTRATQPATAPSDHGWVTFGRVKVDIENETETFERIHPPIEAAHPEDYCHKCGGPNVVWFAPNPVWNKVVREAGEPGILCPVCFIQLAEKAGFWGVWKVALHDQLKQSEAVAAPPATPTDVTERARRAAEELFKRGWVTRDRLSIDTLLNYVADIITAEFQD